MKKYVIYLMFAVAMLLVLPSCNRGTDVDFANNTLTLTLSCNNLGLTRATVDGEDAYNENLVKYIDCYFYLEGATFETPAELVKSNVTVSAGETVGTYTATIPFEEAELTKLFGSVANGSSAKCLIYVIANRNGVSLPMNGENLKLATINELKALTISSEFINSEGSFNKQNLFVMDSDGKPNTGNDTSADGNTNVDIPNDDIVTLNVAQNGTKTLSGIVPLYRTAAKVTLNITRFGPVGGNGVFVDTKGTEATDDDVTYVPNLNKIYAVFHNGVKQSHIAPDIVSNSNLFSGEDKTAHPYFNTGNFVMTPTEGEVKSKLANPFYSYASDWSESGINEESYITLVVPWAIKDGETTKDEKEYFYKVPINYEGDKLERNTHYKINIAVSILGTLDPTKTIEITPSYTILDWSNDEITTAMIDFRYLMVEKNKYVMNNVNEIYIPYWSSHECSKTTITNNGIKAYVVQQDLSTNTPTYESVSTNSYTLDLVVVNGERYIHYKKDLVNDFNNDNFDFTPYEIALRIYHTSDESHYEEITITQYPAIYGESHSNTDDTNGGDDNANKGFVWVNGYQGTSVSGTGTNRYTTSKNGNSVGYFDGANGNTMFDNKSMLVFSISSVQGTEYVIGDPREETVNPDFVGATHRDNISIWDKAPAVGEANTRTLQYYYATDVNHERLKSLDDASTTSFYGSDADAAQHERTYNMIAPKFRVSSAYGMLAFDADVHNYYYFMKKRCASYQEDGYPAGRWRMPTKAEFEFIIYLSAQGKIPELFYDGYYYWCAHGYGIPDLDEKKVEMGYVTLFTPPNNNTRISVRCVYDDWYWGSDPVIDTSTASNDHFIWGDVNRASYAPPMNH
ncbi:MAG: hypothetical protein IKY67_14745 [Paludibacteraceae bacterium]|nr:hypothetical protein [Paludibacteraceae bacterium]